MAYVDADEIWMEQSVNLTKETRSYTRTFVLYFTADGGEDVSAARAALQVERGMSHPGDFLSKVDAFSAVPHQQGIWHNDLFCNSYKATVSYTTDPKFEFENPCDEPPIRSWSPVTVDRELTEDSEGTPLLTSAREIYLGVTEPEHIWAFTFQKNIPKADWNPGTYATWLNRTNEGAAGPFAENTVKIVEISVSESKKTIVDNAEFYYYSMTIVMHIKTIGTWKRRILDAGMKYLVSGVQKDILEDGVPTSTPKLLNGSGGISGGTPFYNEFQTVPMRSFSSFPIEVTFV